MIRVIDLHKRLRGVPVLRGVDFRVPAGEIVAIVGPSGTGKSVLLKHIIGLFVPDGGDVLLDDVSVARADYRRLAAMRRRMGYVFQDAALLDSLTVRQNLRLAIDDRTPDAAVAERIATALGTVRLEPTVLDRRPAELSGGMRKRVGVARAILNAPEVLLYDEPTTGLDPVNVEAVDRLIVRMRDRFGATSLVVTHDLGSLPRIADRVLFLCQGRVGFDGTPSDFFASSDPSVADFRGRVQGSPAPESASWPAMHAVAAS